MKLYLLTQDDNGGYDTYDSCVVAAESEEDAKTIHPSYSYLGDTAENWWKEDRCGSTWADSPAGVSADYLGEAEPNMVRGVICASFNAG